MADRLQIKPRHRATVERLLSEHLPGVEAWAYGSRASGRSHDGSDLDLALRGPGRREIPAARRDSACAMVSISRLSGPGRGDGGKVSNRRGLGRPEGLQARRSVSRRTWAVASQGSEPASALRRRRNRTHGRPLPPFGEGRDASVAAARFNCSAMTSETPERPDFRDCSDSNSALHRRCRHGSRTELRRSRNAPPEEGFVSVQGCFRSKADRLDATGLGQCKARGCFIAVSP